MGRHRDSVAQIIAKGNPRKLSRAQIQARLADELAAERRKSGFVDPAPAEVPAPAAPIPRPAAPNVAATARDYAGSVIAGTIPAGKLVKLAATRFLDDLAHGAERGITFSEAAAQRPADFLASLGLVLLPWQSFLLAIVFGFIAADGTRRVHVLYCEVAKKNGKTTLLAGLALFLSSPASIGGDGEPNPETYVAATSRRQAGEICFRTALQLRTNNAELMSHSTAYKTSIAWEDSFGKFEPLAANSEKLNGMNIHGGILDELADHPSAELWNVFRTSVVARKQPLILGITTAGSQREGNIAWDTRQHAIQVLERLVEDDAFACFIAAPDEGDAWDDESTWMKSNPSLGVTVQLKQLQEMCVTAKAVPSSKFSFLRYNLDIWPSQLAVNSWIDVDDLHRPGCAYLTERGKDQSPAERIREAEERLRGKVCFGGLDLSLTNDLTALALVFPPREENGMYEALFRVWCPEDDIRQRSESHRVPYNAWADAKYITPTPGQVTDFYKVQADILDLRSKYKIRELGFDIALATDLVQRLRSHGMTVTKVAQGFELSPAIQRVESLIKQGRLCLHGNPVANWCIGNSVIFHGLKGDVRLDKQRSREKVDCAAALLDAFHRLFLAPNIFFGGAKIRVWDNAPNGGAR